MPDFRAGAGAAGGGVGPAIVAAGGETTARKTYAGGRSFGSISTLMTEFDTVVVLVGVMVI